MKLDNNINLYEVKTLLDGISYPLYNLATWKNGLPFKKINFSDSGIPVIKIAELNNGIGATTAYTNQIFSDDVHLKKGDLLFSWSGNPETSIDIFAFGLEEGWLNQHIFKVTPDESIIDRDYFYYLMKYLKPRFTKIAMNKQTTGLGHVTIADLKSLKIILPSLIVQKDIASRLKPLDEKIELNNKINQNLLEQAQSLFSFNFPYKVTDDLPSGWKKGTIEEVIDIYDSQRIPLSGNERDQMENKVYPYYGAASLMDYVDRYIFDGKYLLLGEDGTVVDSNGYPILQYVWGKFWVNNHAHVLAGKRGFNVESLYLLFRQTPVKSAVTGAVQMKISQANLKSIQIVIPPESVLKSFNDQIEEMFSLIRINTDENKKVSDLRDSLLPKLMSGEIDVSTLDI